jgi:hypothetical protein
MGKTSILRKMVSEAPPLICPIERSLQGVSAPQEFARGLIADVEANVPGLLGRQTLKRLRKAGVKKIGAKSVEVEFFPVSDEAWKDVVVETFRALDSGVDETVVLLWDELPGMIGAIERNCDATAARDVLDILRFLRETYPGVRMVLSGSIGLHHVVGELRTKGGMWAPTHDLEIVDLPVLDGVDAEYLARELLRNEKLSFEEDAVGTIATSVDSVPFYIHHAVNEIRKLDLTVAPVDADKAREVIEGAVANPSDPWQLRHYVDRIPAYYPQQQALAFQVLDAIAETEGPVAHAEIDARLAARGKPPPDDRLHELLELLCKDHYLEAGYQFRLELVRKAWLARRPPR